jgi:hypothetical protein
MQVALLAQVIQLFDVRARSHGLGPGASKARKASTLQKRSSISEKRASGAKTQVFVNFYGPTKVEPQHERLTSCPAYEAAEW